MTLKNIVSTVFVFLSLFFSSLALSDQPTLQSVQSTSPSTKMKKVVFLYLEKNFTLNHQSFGGTQNGVSRAYLGDTGFLGFGDLLVVNATKAFSDLGVPVLHSGYAPEGKLIEYKKQLFDMLDSQTEDATYIILTPSFANTLGNSFGIAKVNVEISVYVEEVKTGKQVWVGKLNTSTQTGKGFFGSQLFTKKLYDEAYAISIFKLLGEAWARVGLL